MLIENRLIAYTLLALLVALVVSFLMTPIVKTFAYKVGAIDVPKDARRMHKTPIPRLGGLAIFIGFMVSILLFVEITAEMRSILLGAVIIVVLFYDSSQSPRDSDSVTSHHDRMRLHIFIFVNSTHSITVLGSQLEYLTHLDTAGVLYRSSAYRTRIAFSQGLDIRYYIAFVISAVVYVEEMMILLACSCTEIFQSRQFTVHNDLTVMESYRACESAYASRCSRHFVLICKFYGMFWNVKGIDQFRHVEFSVASYKRGYISVFIAFHIICYKQQRFHRLRFIQLQESGNVFDGLCSRRLHFFQR